MTKIVPEWGSRTYIMGIVNVTPDSFSGDGIEGQSDVVAAAVAKARRFVAEGADIIDVGGESTRPGSLPITAAKEIARIVPVIAAIREDLDVLISIDTYRSVVAKAAFNAGADWINDVWGLRMDPALAKVAARKNCPVILMHNRSQPKDLDVDPGLGGTLYRGRV